TGVWESSDGGSSWCRISNHQDIPTANDNMNREPVVDLLVTGPNNLLAATYYGLGPFNGTGSVWTGDGGIYKGTRNGACSWAWTRVMAQPLVTSFARSALDSSLIYAFVGQACCSGAFPGQAAGVYKSTDGGATWTIEPNNGLMNISHGRLNFTSSGPSKLYAS